MGKSATKAEIGTGKIKTIFSNKVSASTADGDSRAVLANVYTGAADEIDSGSGADGGGASTVGLEIPTAVVELGSMETFEEVGIEVGDNVGGTDGNEGAADGDIAIEGLIASPGVGIGKINAECIWTSARAGEGGIGGVVDVGSWHSNW